MHRSGWIAYDGRPWVHIAEHHCTHADDRALSHPYVVAHERPHSDLNGVSDGDTSSDNGSWAYKRVSPDRGMVADKRAAVQDRAYAHLGSGPDRDQWKDHHSARKDRGSCHDGARMNQAVEGTSFAQEALNKAAPLDGADGNYDGQAWLETGLFVDPKDRWLVARVRSIAVQPLDPGRDGATGISRDVGHLLGKSSSAREDDATRHAARTRASALGIDSSFASRDCPAVARRQRRGSSDRRSAMAATRLSALALTWSTRGSNG